MTNDQSDKSAATPSVSSLATYLRYIQQAEGAPPAEATPAPTPSASAVTAMESLVQAEREPEAAEAAPLLGVERTSQVEALLAEAPEPILAADALDTADSPVVVAEPKGEASTAADAEMAQAPLAEALPADPPPSPQDAPAREGELPPAAAATASSAGLVVRASAEEPPRGLRQYLTLEDWLREHTLAADTLVTVAAWPLVQREAPMPLANALIHAAYCLGSAYPVRVRLPEANGAVLIGYAGGDSSPYGLLNLVQVAFGVYADMRQAFIYYQQTFPVRVTLTDGRVSEGLPEVLMAKLTEMLEEVKFRSDKIPAEVDAADLLAAACDRALRDVFGSLVPRDEIGRVLHDPARLSHARKAFEEFREQARTGGLG